MFASCLPNPLWFSGRSLRAIYRHGERQAINTPNSTCAHSIVCKPIRELKHSGWLSGPAAIQGTCKHGWKTTRPGYMETASVLLMLLMDCHGIRNQANIYRLELAFQEASIFEVVPRSRGAWMHLGSQPLPSCIAIHTAADEV